MSRKTQTPLAMLAAVFVFLATCVFGQINLAALAAANPQNPNILNSYGIELANTGDLTGAITVWRRALDYDRNNVHLYNNIGSALKRLGHAEHAFAWYAAALQLQPVYWTYYNLAILYRDRGQLDEACWALGESLRLNSEFSEAVEMLQRIRTNASQSASNLRVAQSPKMSVSEPMASLPGPERIIKKRPSHEIAQVTSPRLEKRQHEVTSAPVTPPAHESGQIFLTFDGGATDAGFDSIVKSLRDYGVKCTFFLTGKFAQQYPDKCRRLLADGHEIGNHSMKHPDMTNFSAEKIAAEIEATEVTFSESFGRRGAPFFRFPFGHQNKRVEHIVENLGYRPVYWHIDTIDWREDPVKTIIGRVEKKLRRDSVILMHLGSKNGAKALNQILHIITSRGYTLARLSDLDARQLAMLP